MADLALTVEIVTPDGVQYRYTPDDPDPQDRHTGLQVTTKLMEGFSTATLTVPRRIDLDYGDLQLFSQIVVASDDGDVVWEGRVDDLPRSMTDTHQITVNCVGWVAHMRDRPMTAVYVDRDVSGWGDPPTAEKIRLATAGVDSASFSWATDNGALVCALPNSPLGAQVTAEAWYVAPAGLAISKVAYAGGGGSLGFPGYQVSQVLFPKLDHFVGGDEVDNAPFPAAGQVAAVTPTVQTRYCYIQVYSNGTAATPPAGAMRSYSPLAVYCTTVPTVAVPGDCDGVLASDVICDAIDRYCPMLDSAGVQPTGYPIPHLTFPTDTDPYDVILAANGFHLYNLAVWEGRKVTYTPPDLTDYDWQVDYESPGVTTTLQGDTVGDLCNGIVVTYTDLLTGQSARLTPDDTTDLADPDLSNPATMAGLKRWPNPLTLSNPTTQDAATTLGRLALAERLAPTAPGDITVQGCVLDKAGNRQPAYRVRAGDRLVLKNFVNDRIRQVTETVWDADSKTMTVTVDSSRKVLDAVIDRLSTSLQAAGVGQ